MEDLVVYYHQSREKALLCKYTGNIRYEKYIDIEYELVHLNGHKLYRNRFKNSLLKLTKSGTTFTYKLIYTGIFSQFKERLNAEIQPNIVNRILTCIETYPNQIYNQDIIIKLKLIDMEYRTVDILSLSNRLNKLNRIDIPVLIDGIKNNHVIDITNKHEMIGQVLYSKSFDIFIQIVYVNKQILDNFLVVVGKYHDKYYMLTLY